MAHRVATDEICVKRGMGKSPSSGRRGLIRVSACCLLAPKDLACYDYYGDEYFFSKLRMKNKKIFGEVVTCFFDQTVV